ncbi:VanZ family protein [Paenibacillus aceris]|uniref:Glycopeptide antibiotics resistance protein n=1 Tax=Paenibacillus aceris TaxID=869555 RepID=A0ABS4HZC5_9BACL|nr:VanZ family protein [Paenibacillus aceris]MBP1964003.1 glycopeptide antibiotics resistance protein [Paenibacillus aceris]NHW34580.1 VanZ family protein [Paenibacillus aceris]
MGIKYIRPLMWLLFIGYTSCLLYWMFLGFGRQNLRALGHFDYNYNIVPFRTIGMYIRHAGSFPMRTWAINLFGNIVVFMPFGILLPFLFGMARRYRAFLLLFGCTLVGLEVMQMLLRVGSLDVDDVILNVLGASLAYGLFMIFKRGCASNRVEMG